MKDDFMDHYGYYEQDITIRRRGGKISISRETSTGFGLKPAFMRGTLTVHSFSVEVIEEKWATRYVIGIWGRLAYIRNKEFYNDPVIIIIDVSELKKEWWGVLVMYMIYEQPPLTEEALTGKFWDTIKEVLNEVLPWL